MDIKDILNIVMIALLEIMAFKNIAITIYHMHKREEIGVTEWISFGISISYIATMLMWAAVPAIIFVHK